MHSCVIAVQFCPHGLALYSLAAFAFGLLTPTRSLVSGRPPCPGTCKFIYSQLSVQCDRHRRQGVVFGSFTNFYIPVNYTVVTTPQSYMQLRNSRCFCLLACTHLIAEEHISSGTLFRSDIRSFLDSRLSFFL